MVNKQPSIYVPFEESKSQESGAGGATAIIGLVVIVAIMFVAISLLRAAVQRLDPVPIDETEKIVPEARPPDPERTTVMIAQLRPRGELAEQAESVDDGWISDTVVCTGRVTNAGPNGKLTVRVRAVFSDETTPPVEGEQTFTVINAGSSEPYRIELEIKNVKKANPMFIHDVYAP